MTNEELEELVLELRDKLKELAVKLDVALTEIKILKEGSNI